MGIVQCGVAFLFLTPPVYGYLQGLTIEDVPVAVEDIPGFEVKEFINKV